MLINSRKDLLKLKKQIPLLSPEELVSRKDEIVEKVRQIEEYLSNEPKAAAVAAPQLGIELPIICIKKSDGSLLSLINPVIGNIDKQNIYYSQEGCMSLGFFGKDSNVGINVFAIRTKELDVTYYHVNHLGEIKKANTLYAKDKFGPKNEILSKDASAIQHEMNHLFGVLLLDVAVPLDLLKENDEQFKGFTKVYRVYFNIDDTNTDVDYLIENEDITLYHNKTLNDLVLAPVTFIKDEATGEMIEDPTYLSKPIFEKIEKQFIGFFKEKEEEVNETDRVVSTESGS